MRFGVPRRQAAQFFGEGKWQLGDFLASLACQNGALDFVGDYTKTSGLLILPAAACFDGFRLLLINRLVKSHGYVSSNPAFDKSSR